MGIYRNSPTPDPSDSSPSEGKPNKHKNKHPIKILIVSLCHVLLSYREYSIEILYNKDDGLYHIEIYAINFQYSIEILHPCRSRQSILRLDVWIWGFNILLKSSIRRRLRGSWSNSWLMFQYSVEIFTRGSKWYGYYVEIDDLSIFYWNPLPLGKRVKQESDREVSIFYWNPLTTSVSKT